MPKIDDLQTQTRVLRKDLRENKKAKELLLEEIESWEEEIRRKKQERNKEQKDVEDTSDKGLREEWKALSVLQRKQQNNQREIKAFEAQQSQDRSQNRQLGQTQRFSKQILIKAQQELAVKQKKVKDIKRREESIERNIRQSLASLQRKRETASWHPGPDLRKNKKELSGIQNQLARWKREITVQERHIRDLKNQGRLRESNLDRNKRQQVRQGRMAGELMREKRTIEEKIKRHQQAEVKIKREAAERLKRLKSECQQALTSLEAKIAGGQQKIRRYNQKLQHAEIKMKDFLGRYWRELHSSLQDKKK